MIIVGFIIFSIGTLAWAIIGTILLLACCFLMFRQGCGIGEGACGLKSSVDRAQGKVDVKTASEAYNPSIPRKVILRCAIVPLIISLIYIGVYFTALNTQGYIYGDSSQDENLSAEEIEEEIENAIENAVTETIELAPEDATENAVEGTAEDAASATEIIAEEEEGMTFGEWLDTMTNLDIATLALRLLTLVLAMPFWPVLAFWQSSFILLNPASIALLILYPFVLPTMLYLGYLQGPKLWKRTEAAMAKGRRRAKARSRIVKKKTPKAQKPMI